jgi:Mn-dependent DtxR family transcriptional regulator
MLAICDSCDYAARCEHQLHQVLLVVKDESVWFATSCPCEGPIPKKRLFQVKQAKVAIGGRAGSEGAIA